MLANVVRHLCWVPDPTLGTTIDYYSKAHKNLSLVNIKSWKSSNKNLKWTDNNFYRFCNFLLAGTPH